MTVANQKTIQVHDLKFKKYLDESLILDKVQEMGSQITADYQDLRPIFLAVLKGSFVFCGDLIKACDIDCEIEFIKVSSYHGTQSSKKVKLDFGVSEALEGRHVIIIEDIVDEGHTIKFLKEHLQQFNPVSLKIASLLFKPASYQHDMPIDYIGFEIPPNFVVGYGLDYNGLGRNLRDIYTLHSQE